MLKRILLSLLASVSGVLSLSCVCLTYGDDIYWRSGNVWKNVKVLEYKDGDIKVRTSKDTQWWKAFDRIVLKEIDGEEIIAAKKEEKQQKVAMPKYSIEKIVRLPEREEKKEKELVEKKEVSSDRESKIVYYLSNTKYVYSGMSATYVELSAIYSYCYENPKFIGWEVLADPDNPVAVLATAKFKTTGVQADILNAPESEVSHSIKKKMREAVPLLSITWRVNDLISLKITPYNFYAKDAITIYKDIADGIRKLAE
ncbi:hypothetical protein KAU86_03400 [bacterium]|nr:hypothetical protein [bacterium]